MPEEKAIEAKLGADLKAGGVLSLKYGGVELVTVSIFDILDIIVKKSDTSVDDSILAIAKANLSSVVIEDLF